MFLNTKQNIHSAFFIHSDSNPFTTGLGAIVFNTVLDKNVGNVT